MLYFDSINFFYYKLMLETRLCDNVTVSIKQIPKLYIDYDNAFS